MVGEFMWQCIVYDHHTRANHMHHALLRTHTCKQSGVVCTAESTPPICTSRNTGRNIWIFECAKLVASESFYQSDVFATFPKKLNIVFLKEERERERAWHLFIYFSYIMQFTGFLRQKSYLKRRFIKLSQHLQFHTLKCIFYISWKFNAIHWLYSYLPRTATR